MAKLSKRLRYEILRRDGFRCRYCGAEPGKQALHIDHVVPEALGGTNEPANLATSCQPCNSGKTSTTPDAPVVEEVAEGALRGSAAMQAAAALKEKEIQDRRSRHDWFLAIWNGYKLESNEAVPLPSDWSEAVTRLETAGLTYLLVEDAVEAAMKAYRVLPENRFRYFCGVAWNMVTSLQEKAQRIASGDEGDDDPLGVSIYERLSRSKLEGHVWELDSAAHRLLEQVPVWAHESAERMARHDWYCAGEPDAPRLDVLPSVLRHLGNVLGKSNIQPEREGD